MRRNIIFALTIVAALTGARNVATAAAVDTVNAVDTAADNAAAPRHDDSVPIDVSDSADAASARNDGDTPANASDSADAAPARINTAAAVDTSINADAPRSPSGADAKQDSVPKLSGAFFGFGFGLSFGEIPLFTLWQNALPAKLEQFGLSTVFVNPSTGDTLPLVYRVVESPEPFNFVLPLGVSLYNVKKNSVTVFSLSYFQNSKQFQSAITSGNDTLNRRVNVYQTLNYYSLTIEASYHAAIPPAFFSIDGAQQSFFSLSAGVSPLNYFTRGGAAASAPDSVSRMKPIADSVSAKLPGFSANGMAFTWRLGINAMRAYANGGGIEMGLYYSGSYSAYFYENGEAVMKSKIHAAAGDADKPLSFLSNRVEFKVSFMRPVKRGQKESAK